MNKKPYSDPRWREWPKKGIVFSNKSASRKVVNELDNWLKEIKKAEKKDG